MNGAQALIQTLVNGGVEVAFTNPGTSEMHFVAALDEVDGMRAILCLFEGVCTGAADGYARMMGKPAATLLHLGPGLGNGIANLHNARRAEVPMVNIVGDHATFHLQYDAPLTSDIVSLATPVSAWVRSGQNATTISQDAADAIRVANTAPGQIATLILPADTAWNDSQGRLASIVPPPTPTINGVAVDEVARVLRKGQPTVFMLGGDALLEKGLHLASRLAQATNAQIIANRPTRRLQRGAGRPVVRRMPYPIPIALKLLKDAQQMILVGTQPPVSFFGYPNTPSQLAPAGCHMHTLATAQEDIVAALEALVETLHIPQEAGSLYQFERPALATGNITPPKVWQSLSALMPEHAIICDESVTSARGSEIGTAGAPPHDFLYITGGAIGIGLPFSVGAAVACPNQKVISMQADGSAMYTVQALWTQAREQLDIVTVLFNNRAYRILQSELKRVGANSNARKAQELLNLNNPNINWVQLANGMGVPATRATTMEALNKQLAAAIAGTGPHLIEAVF